MINLGHNETTLRLSTSLRVESPGVAFLDAFVYLSISIVYIILRVMFLHKAV